MKTRQQHIEEYEEQSLKDMKCAFCGSRDLKNKVLGGECECNNCGVITKFDFIEKDFKI